MFTRGRKIWPWCDSEVKRISSRGRRPSWIAWRVSENAPVITAWLAMIVAAVASSTNGMMPHSGTSRNSGCSIAAGLESTSAPWPK